MQFYQKHKGKISFIAGIAAAGTIYALLNTDGCKQNIQDYSKKTKKVHSAFLSENKVKPKTPTKVKVVVKQPAKQRPAHSNTIFPYKTETTGTTTVESKTVRKQLTESIKSGNDSVIASTRVSTNKKSNVQTSFFNKEEENMSAKIPLTKEEDIKTHYNLTFIDYISGKKQVSETEQFSKLEDLVNSLNKSGINQFGLTAELSEGYILNPYNSENENLKVRKLCEGTYDIFFDNKGKNSKNVEQEILKSFLGIYSDVTVLRTRTNKYLLFIGKDFDSDEVRIKKNLLGKKWDKVQYGVCTTENFERDEDSSSHNTEDAPGREGGSASPR